MPVHIVMDPGRLAPSTSTVKNVESILKYRESWGIIGMPEPRTCNLRRTRPMGPMILCNDLACYARCLELTSYEMERERGELTRYELLKEAEG